MSNNSKVPQIRLKGFTEDWEQRKLGNEMNVTSVKRVLQSDWTNEGIRFLRARDIVAASKNEEPDDYLYISKEQYEKYSALSGKVAIGDMLVTGVGTIGIPYLISNSEPIYFKDGNIIWFQNEEIIDGKFFYYSFCGKLIQKFIKDSAGIGTVGTYTIESGKKTPIFLPPKNEQHQLGVFLSNFDNLITLHQRKYDKLVNIKMALLERMFPQAGEPAPAIRFKGFTDAWEQRKLGAMAYRVNEMSAIEGLPRVEYEDIEAGQGTLNKNLKEKVSNKKGILFQHSDILYGKLRPYLKNWLFADFLGIAVGDFWVLRSNSVAHSFIYRLLQTPAFDYVANQSSGSKMPRADWKLVSNTEFSFPVSTEEQEKIGLLFLKLDNLITLHQRKLEKLKNIKSALLEKMFVS